MKIYVNSKKKAQALKIALSCSKSIEQKIEEITKLVTSNVSPKPTLTEEQIQAEGRAYAWNVFFLMQRIQFDFGLDGLQGLAEKLEYKQEA